MSLWLSGIGVSRGIAIARIQKLHGGDLEAPEYTLSAERVEPEIARFYAAVQRAREQLRQVRGHPSQLESTRPPPPLARLATCKGVPLLAFQ